MKLFKILLAVFVIIISILGLMGNFEIQMPISLLDISLLNGLNTLENHKNNINKESIFLFLSAIFTILVPIYILFIG
ncbi:MAG: hypothetical protein ACLTUN_10015 [Paraclostridium sordellii]|uniref:hypothetical protein n=2 Tax=Paraclostridium sordellii TaxID=1505 RepID=UPI0012D7AC16|nr:hypothetical protein [Paeniclostridium sordellii]